ncbi:MAG: insulinase family protein, partial [Alphaproteobacteria bacterium]|nr:insulinase family protein [Alphaproteobacteria bacterium]
ENLHTLIEIIADELQNSLFDNNVIENEKKVIRNEYRRYVNANLWWLFKAEKLLGAHNVLGTPEIIQSFTKQHLLDYYHKHLSSDNMLIVISGKISNEEILKKQLEQLFSWIPKQNIPNMSINITPTIAHNFISDTKNQKITFAWADTIESTIVNRKRKAAMGLFRKILQDRLIYAVREQNGLSYSIQCSTMGWADAKLHTINSETLPQNLERLITTVADVCRNIISDTPITAKELFSAQMVVKLQNAQIMESGVKRCALYANYFKKYKSVYNISAEINQINHLVLTDIMMAGHNFFAAPISILTQGDTLECDVKDAWYKHFVV